MRIGVFGGTFDPIHLGHLVAAVNVRYALDLDLLLLVVANVPWQKVDDREIAPAADRYAMVEAALAGLDGITASDIEISRGGVSFTADTLAELAQRYPGAELFCVLGADAAAGIGTWERADEVGRRSTIAVINRPGTPRPANLPGGRVDIEIPALEVSSTDLRARVRDGRPLEFLIPEGAIRCIRQRGLYASGR